MLKKLTQIGTAALLILINCQAYAQDSTKKHLPIIDVHVHAMHVNPGFAMDLCPWFLSSMPGGDPNQAPPAFINTDCATPLRAAKTDKEFQDSLMATMKRLNMTIIASGDATVIRSWQKAAAPGPVSYTHLTLPTNREV